MNSFSSLRHKGCIPTLKLSKVTIQSTKKQLHFVLSPVLTIHVSHILQLIVFHIRQNVEIEYVRP
jgi:hypothetical protein